MSEYNENEVDEKGESTPESQDGKTKEELKLAPEENPVEKLQKDILYLKAEFDNYRKRMIRDQDAAIRNSNRAFTSELLVIVDFFDRALKHSTALKTGATPELTNFISGIEMTRHELNQMLGRFGVELIGQAGEKFDPNKHEAISQVEAGDELVDKVVEVFEKGALLHGKTLKPARVVVGKKAG